MVRYRTKLVQSRTSELQRLGNVLQDAGVKVDSVASSITTKSARAMIEALIDGERRPGVLADSGGAERSRVLSPAWLGSIHVSIKINDPARHRSSPVTDGGPAWR